MPPKYRKTRIAIAYDFDGTLSPGNMQEYEFIPKLGMKSKAFWNLVQERAKTQDADPILAYMGLMVEKATASQEVRFTRKAFVDFGRNISLYKGVETWFDRVNAFACAEGAIVDHFIISSGLKEMIEGTAIGSKFKSIFASSFMYDQNGVACWPALAVNYTTKTQFLFRINKGILDVWDNEKINEYVPKEDRPFPFANMIYLGDGATDVPCMKLVRAQGGHSIAVYGPGSKKGKCRAQKLVKEQRAHFVLPADYTAGGQLECVMKLIVRRIVADDMVRKAIGDPRKAVRICAVDTIGDEKAGYVPNAGTELCAADGPAEYDVPAKKSDLPG